MFANLSHLILAVDGPSLSTGSTSQVGGWVDILKIVAIIAVVMIVPFVLGNVLARMLRMNDYAWRFGVVLFSLALAIAVILLNVDYEKKTLRLRLGVDLKGGVILIYEADEDQDSATPADPAGLDPDKPRDFMPGLIAALGQRLNPDGLKEIVIRPYGERSVEITVPDATDLEIKQLKDLITKAGVLEFHIVANTRDHEDVLALAEKQLENEDRSARLQRRVLDGGVLKGLWVRVARSKDVEDGHRRLKAGPIVVESLLRDSRTGQKVTLSRATPPEEQLAEQGIEDIDVLMAVEERESDRVTGEHLGVVRASFDDTMNPCISFTMNGVGTSRMRYLTGNYLPETQADFFRHLGIVMDGELLSAPRILSIISDQGQITGQFEQSEVDFLVGILRAGRLQTTLKKNPLSEDRIGSTLGDATIRSGIVAIVVALAIVLVFILVYYRFAGLVACVSLLANLLFTIALVILLKATMTLPGLAGIVLTVGMSVDANVLIFERIREELARGAALRMAIRNGFSRATITIVDSNLTTLLTAIILYWIGTDQIRGFAVTLILGILMSMFTAIFCARVALDIAERGFRMKTLRMFQIFGATRIDFVRQRAFWISASLLVILAGMVGVVLRGRGILDTDFTGGTKVVMLLKDPMNDTQINSILRETLGEVRVQGASVTYTLHRMEMAGQDQNTVWQVETSIPNQMELDDKSVVDGVEFLQNRLQERFELARYEMQDPTELQERAIRPADSSETRRATGAGGENASGTTPEKNSTERGTPNPDATNAGTSAESPTDSDQRTETPGTETPGTEAKDTLQESPGNDLLAQEPSPESSAAESSGDDEREQPAGRDAGTSSPTSPGTGTRGSRTQADSEIRTTGNLSFGNPIVAETLISEIIDAGADVNIVLSASDVQLENPNWDPEVREGFRDWTVTLNASQNDAAKVLAQLKNRLNATPIWPASSSIGGQVASNMQTKALIAMFASLIMITIYVWIRFQHVIFGIAAVVALIHDVLVTVGAIALSYWLAGAFGFLLIEEFKISLPVVAALLTLVGYSINDTIVIFDRIREVRGKSPQMTAEMVNTSVNQTISRTVLTFATTWIVIFVLYVWGGEGIHGFAFCLLVGLVTGTYSTIFIAAPLALWILDTQKPKAHVSQSVREKTPV